MKKIYSFGNALFLSVLTFMLAAFSQNAFSQTNGIYESYAILSLNGGANAYYDMNAGTGNPDFQGSALGSFNSTQSLVIKGGQNKTFKCDGGNITGGNLYYRVWRTSLGASGSFTSIAYSFASNDGGGCGGNQTWEGTGGATNIISGLTVPGNYTLEVYSDAPGFPGTAFSNNGGANYKATFNYCGPTTGALPAGNYAIPGCFTVASAITYINANGVSGTGAVQFDVAAGYTETAPAGGYSITATGTSTLAIKFVKSGAGTNPTFTAFTPQTVSNINDGIFKIIGGDYITIDGFTMQENTSNTVVTPAASNTMTEFGVALFYAAATNGAQNNTIQNCTISLNRTYLNTFGIYSNTRTTATAVTTLAEATSAAGSNSFNKIYGNVISNVNFGIVLIGCGTNISAIDNGNDIGGSSVATGNTITNWGGGASLSAYNSLTSSNYCIFDNQQINDNVSYNTITSAALAQSVTTGGFLKNYSVASPTTGTITTTINNNTITITNNPSAATTGGIIGINNQGLTPLLATATMNINNNSVQNCVLGGSTSTTNGLTAITNLSLPGTMNITGNNILNNSITATTATIGSFFGISNSGAAGTVNINTNIIRGYTNNTNTSYSGSYIGISNSGAVVTALNIISNQFGNTSGTALTYSLAAASSINNVIQNTGGASTCALSISSNSIQGLTFVSSGSVSAILNTSGFAGGNITMNTNAIGTSSGGFISFSASNSSGVNGIINQGGSSTSALSITGNDIRGITHTTQGSSVHTYISNSFATLSQNISTNTFTNLNVNTTGSVAFISNSVQLPASGFQTINGNSIVTAFNKGGAGGTVQVYLATTTPSSPGGTTHTANLNNFSNITVTGATTLVGWSNLEGAPGPTKTITNNIFSNWAGGSSPITVIAHQWSGDNTSVSNNTISNITGTGAITGISISSSQGGVSTMSHNSNIISGLVSSGSGGAVVAITGGSASVATMNINGNTINGLSSTLATTSTAITISAAAIVNISKNKIYDISGNQTGTIINGINLTSGTTFNVNNNLIGDLRATAATSLNSITGINANGTSTFNIYFNTIYLNASSSGATFGTSCVTFLSTATSLNLRNNNLLNLSTPGTEGSNLASNGISAVLRRSTGTAATIPANYATSSNKNNFWVNPVAGTNNHCTYVEGTSTITNSMNTYGQMKTFMSTRDQNSYADQLGTTAINVNYFVSTAGANANYLNITAATATQLESGADVIAGITDDYSGAAGNRATTPDVGAWEFAGTLIDLTAPAISYTVLSNTLCTSDRTLSSVTVTDPSSINTTAGTRPRLYFKKSSNTNAFNDNTNATDGWKYVEATGGGGSPFSFTTDYSLVNGGVASGNTIQYFVVAQDIAVTPNVGINSGSFAATPASVALTSAAFPIGGSINSYLLTPGLSGSVNVGPGQTYTTLTGAAGLFSTINGGGLTGNLTANITGNITTETGTNVLNAINYGCAGSYTLTIKPTGTFGISGTNSNGLITLNGADNVIIDGSTGSTANTVCPIVAATRNLTITNTNTGTSSAVVWLQSNGADGATNNKVINCNIVGNSNTTTLFGVGSGNSTIGITSTGTSNNSNSYINNSISKVQYGIYSGGLSAAAKNTGTVINQNLMNDAAASNNPLRGGILVNFDNGVQINANKIQNITLTATTGTCFGIALGLIPGNTVTVFTGSDVINATVSKNTIGNIVQLNATGYSAFGLILNTVTSGTSEISNNFIYDILAASTASDFSGAIIAGGGAGSTTRVYQNSVSLTGARGAATYPSYCLAIGGSDPTVNVRNNIFINKQTSSNSAKMYTIGTASATFANLTSDNNDLFVTGANGFVGQTGGLGTAGTDRTTLLAWQTATVKDALSKNVDAVFISSSDLHLNTSNASNLANLNGTAATGTGITDDIDCDARGSFPDIGADQFGINGGLWTGTTSSNWTVTTNWGDLTVPATGADITIPTLVPNNPALVDNRTIGALSLGASTALSLSGQTLTINGAVSGFGTLTGSSSSNLTINGTAGTILFTSGGTNNYLKDLSLGASGTLTLGNELNITAGSTPGTVTVANGGVLTTGGNLTLKSDNDGTARVAINTSNSTYISGDVTVERYIPANNNRAWRLLGVPTKGGQTIHQAWQENQSAGDLSLSGKGTQIASNSATWAADGFDFQTPGNTLLNYNAATDTWLGNYGKGSATSNTIESKEGYMLYIRGDRTIVPGPGAITPTTLRSKGTLYQGTDAGTTVGANQYRPLANLYPSTIDFRLLSKTGDIDSVFYVWDPKLVGSYGLGGYQTLTWNGGIGRYTINPGGGSYGVTGSNMDSIQSGQGFFVHSTTSGGSIIFNEHAKIAGSRASLFNTNGPVERFITKMFAVNGANNDLADATLTYYDASNTNAVNGNDAKKLMNFGENIGMLRDGYNLATELRELIAGGDTIYLNMSGLKQQGYQFELIADHLDHPNLLGKLVDNYLVTNTPLNLNGTTAYNFTVNADPASSAANRFTVIFYKAGPLPVTFTSIKAQQQNNDIAVEWKVDNQTNIRQYEVERSTDGRIFTKVATQVATGANGSSATYNWLDVNAQSGDNFYRVRSIGIGGDVQYTRIVKVHIGKGVPSITVYPNPVTERVITLQFTDMVKGTYMVNLVNPVGQTVQSKQVNHNGANAGQTLTIDKRIAKGNYQLQIVKPGGEKEVIKLVIVE